MSYVKIVKIDPAKLRAELNRRNTTPSIASRAIGYNDSYITNACGKGSMTQVAVNALENIFNIKSSAYVVPDRPVAPAPAPPPPAPFELDYVRLRNLIYDAVYTAVKKAWSE